MRSRATRLPRLAKLVGLTHALARALRDLRDSTQPEIVATRQKLAKVLSGLPPDASPQARLPPAGWGTAGLSPRPENAMRLPAVDRIGGFRPKCR